MARLEVTISFGIFFETSSKGCRKFFHVKMTQSAQKAFKICFESFQDFPENFRKIFVGYGKFPEIGWKFLQDNVLKVFGKNLCRFKINSPVEI